MATITVWVRMILKLPPVRKNGRTSALRQNNPITKASPSNGPNEVSSLESFGLMK